MSEAHLEASTSSLVGHMHVRSDSASPGAPLEIEAPPGSLTDTAAEVNIGWRCVAIYANALQKAPLLTKAASSGLLFGASDACAQGVETLAGSGDVNSDIGTGDCGSGSIDGGIGSGDCGSGDIGDGNAGGAGTDWPRLLTCALLGTLFGPAAHFWYGLMQRGFPRQRARDTLCKTVLGQTIFGPCFTVLFFAATLCEQASGVGGLLQLPRKLRRDLLRTQLVGLGFWSTVDLLSYNCVVPRLGEAWIPLFASVGSFMWTVFLSLCAHLQL